MCVWLQKSHLSSIRWSSQLYMRHFLIILTGHFDTRRNISCSTVRAYDQFFFYVAMWRWEDFRTVVIFYPAIRAPLFWRFIIFLHSWSFMKWRGTFCGLLLVFLFYNVLLITFFFTCQCIFIFYICNFSIHAQGFPFLISLLVVTHSACHFRVFFYRYFSFHINLPVIPPLLIS